MPMGYGPAPAPNPMNAGPMPPSMHWALVWLLGGITFGGFTLIWTFKQAGFVKKIDPSSKAVLLMTLAVVGQLALVLGAVGLIMASASSGSFNAGVAGIIGIVMLLSMVIAVMWLIAIFGMRSSLVRYYNSVEPMGLKLSGVMTFFFNILYFQYHLTRIANWKTTGVLG
jgi:membrane-bound ClpP family serine protease